MDNLPRISYLVARADRGIRRLLDEVVATHGVSTPEYTAMSALRLRPGLSSAQLARRAFVTPQAMNQIVAGLEDRGLIHRSTDPNHRRILQTFLTAEGKRVLAACDTDVDRLEDEVLGVFSDDQRTTFRELLETYIVGLTKERQRARADSTAR